MSYILNISTAVPEFKLEENELVSFYSKAVNSEDPDRFLQKISYLNRKTRINSRYSCISDYKGEEIELFTDGNYLQPVEARMEMYRKKIKPLATKVIDKLFAECTARPADVTHLITVSCTGLMAPGLEFYLAEHYEFEKVEKIGVNFLGCYAAVKALKLAHYIAQANPKACILIVSAELCSLHFNPSVVDEDIIANLLFADGAAAVIMTGDKNPHAKNKTVLKIDDMSTAFIPNTADLMTWNITSTAFKMFLSADVVSAIKSNLQEVVDDFLGSSKSRIDYWAIHPGGVKIIDAVKESLGLDNSHVEDSMNILQNYGNMSSPTILFILSSMLEKIKAGEFDNSKKIFSCAFGPGLNVELLSLSSVNTSVKTIFNYSNNEHVVEL